MPLVRTAGFENLALMLDYDAFYFRLDVEIVTHPRQPIDNRLKRFLGNGSRLGRAGVFRLKDCGRFREPGLLARFFFLERLYIVERHFKSKIELGFK